MRMWAVLLVLLAVPARAGSTLEPAFSEASKSAAQAAKKAKKRKIFPLVPAPAPAGDAARPAALDEPLAALRDAALASVTVNIAGRDWTVGPTADAEYDDFHLVLTSGADRLLAPLAPLRRFLEADGVVVSGDEGPVLRLNARLSLIHPINGISVVAVDPAVGRTSRDSFTVGELVDALKAKGRAFRAGDQELHLFVQPEASADGKSLGERAIFVARFAGVKSRGWAIRESALETGKPVRVFAAGRVLVLLKTADERLIVRDAGKIP